MHIDTSEEALRSSAGAEVEHERQVAAALREENRKLLTVLEEMRLRLVQVKMSADERALGKVEGGDLDTLMAEVGLSELMQSAKQNKQTPHVLKGVFQRLYTDGQRRVDKVQEKRQLKRQNSKNMGSTSPLSGDGIDAALMDAWRTEYLPEGVKQTFRTSV